MTPDPERLRTLLALVAIGLRHEIANHLAAHPRAASYDSDRTTGGAGSDPTPTALHAVLAGLATATRWALNMPSFFAAAQLGYHVNALDRRIPEDDRG